MNKEQLLAEQIYNRVYGSVSDEEFRIRKQGKILVWLIYRKLNGTETLDGLVDDWCEGGDLSV